MLAAAFLVVASLLPGTAAAEPQRGLIVVEGKGNTVADLVIGQDAVLRYPVPSLLGGSSYVGALVERLGGGSPVPVVGAVQVRAFADSTRDEVGVVGVETRLAPGRYRVTLFGDGPVRAQWQLADDQAPGIRVETRTATPVRFLGRAETMLPGVSGARVDMVGSVPAGRRVLQMALLHSTSVEDFAMCATTAAACNDEPAVACPPSPVPCSAPSPRVGAGDPRMFLQLAPPADRPRALRWSLDGARAEVDRLRAAALVF